MSWLLVSTAPALLMLTAIGLDRMESGLHAAVAAPAEGAPPVARPEVAATTTSSANLRFHPTPRPNPV